MLECCRHEGIRSLKQPCFAVLYRSITPVTHAPSFCYPEYLEDAFEFGITEKSDLNGAFALSITKMHLCAEALAQLIFEIGEVRVTREWRRSRFRGRASVARLQLRY